MRRPLSCSVCDFMEKTRISWLSGPFWLFAAVFLVLSPFIWPLVLLWPLIAVLALIETIRAARCGTCRVEFGSPSGGS